MTLSIAIVGAGPSGFYAAEALIKRDLDCRIDILESLPTPFGLIRFGVAPDHEKTKRVSRSYEKTALDEAVQYFGNVEVGRDIDLDKLRELYDAVILAIGAPLDRALDVPGGDLKGVVGSAEFVGWYNGHPDFRDLDPDLDCESVAIVGNGNVALDVARVLAKTPAEMAKTDLPEYAAEAIHSSPIGDIYIFGRRGPNEAKWTNVELREMGRLQDAVPLLDPAVLPEAVSGEMSARDRRLKEKNLATLKSFPEVAAAGKSKRIHFEFFARPVEVLGSERVEALRLERTRVEDGQAVGSDEFFEIPCGLVVASIGYRSRPVPGVPFDERRGVIVNRKGRVAPGLYAVGWAMRGPSGVIGTNKPDAELVAGHIEADLAPAGKPGRRGLERYLDDRGVTWVSYDDWKQIEAAEIAAAGPEAPRKKLIRIKDMLAVLDRLPERRAQSGT